MSKSLVIPGFIYDECLDTAITAVPDESGWPTPERRKRGRGHQFVYAVTPEQRDDIIEWIRDFGEGISYGVDDPSIGRRMVRWVDKTEGV